MGDSACKPFRKYERAPFDAERCTRCGLCFSECPVLRMPGDVAGRAILELAEHLHRNENLSSAGRKVLQRCTSCFACNAICPEDCRPANLILDLWRRQYLREGLPVRARCFLPHSPSNFRTYVIDRLPEDERAAVESWRSLEPVEEIFYPGCNIIAAPYLTFSKLFSEMTIRGGLEYCCGEMYFRMGLYDQLEQVARKTTKYFATLGVRRVHMLCTAGLNLFTNILPQFGADFASIEFIPLLKSIHARLVSGELPLLKRFDGETVTVQDSCHAKFFEEAYSQWPRRILETLGFRVAEAPRNSEAALCCGIGGGFSHVSAYGKREMISSQRACVANAASSGADCIAAYCAGCLQMMSVAKYVALPRTPVYHVLELVQKAIGERPRRRQRKLAFDFLIGTLRNQEGGGRRFFIPPIA